MPDLGIDVLFKGTNMLRLLQGLWVAMKISIVSILISMPLGILVGALMTVKNRFVKAIFRVYLEFIRIMPQLVLLFIVYFGSTRALGWNLSGEVASVIVFVLWGTAEMGDLVRGALISIPKHQYESSEALGFSKIQTYLYIIIPQTVRRLIPLSINLITRMIKTTSLVLMIGVVEMLKVAQQIIEANRMSSPNAAFGVFLVVFVLYFFACWPFGVLAGFLHSSVVLYTGTPVAGMNLYNNGFSGGLVAIVLYPIIIAIVRHRKPTLVDQDYFDSLEHDEPVTPPVPHAITEEEDL